MGIRNWIKRLLGNQAPNSPKEERPEDAAPPVEAPAAEPAAEAEVSEGSVKAEAEAEAHEVFEVDEIIAADPRPRLDDVDFTDFWHDTKESERRHISGEPDFRVIREVEESLGFKLPGSYIELMKKHNGGLVNRCWYPLRAPAKSFDDYVQITDILGIGREAPYSLCGRFGSQFLKENWGHGADGTIAICNTTKPGRALVFLDYRRCGANGEPEVLYADSQTGEAQTLARNFETFVRGLRAGASNP